MAYKPYTPSASAARKLSNGDKTMMRCVVQGLEECTHRFDGFDDDGNGLFVFGGRSNGMLYDGTKPIKPPYQYGDILWVREPWRPKMDGQTGIDFGVYEYQADDKREPNDEHGPWRPSICMPKEAVRTFLVVKDLRAERLGDITVRDVGREGVELPDICKECIDMNRRCIPQKAVDVFCGIEDEVVDLYADIWNHLNSKCGHPFSANPWVWVYSLKRISKPEGWPNV